MFRRTLAVALLLAAPVSAADPELAKKIEAITDGPDYAQAHWGVLVVDAKTGDTVYARNPDKLFAPASVTKLYSCAAALVAHGPDWTTSTPVYFRGERSADGTVKGDLILVAKGDLTFGGRTDKDGRVAFKDTDHTYSGGTTESELTDTDPLAGLDALAKQVRASGITAVTGDVVIDDRLFDAARSTGSGPPAVSPIVVNDNLVDVVITPGANPGDPAAVNVRPAAAYIHVDAAVTTTAKDSKPKLEIGDDPRNVVVRGTVPAGKPLVRIVPVGKPADFARAQFVEVLKKNGVRVSAPVVAANDAAKLPDKAEYARLEQVAAFTSPPLKDVLRVTLKVSHNLYASTLPCLVAVKRGSRTLAAGLREQGKILKELGVDVGTISFGGGAGGAGADKVTPRATVQLLRAMRKRPHWEAYKAGFPTLGVDGTLATVVPADSPARGKVFAKTGTYYWEDAMNGRTLVTSKALAGVMTTTGGTELLFAMFVNDVPAPKGVTPTREGKVLGKICEVIHDHVK